MSITVNKQPFINLGGGETYYISNAKTQIFYRLIRKDDDGIAWSNDGGFVKYTKAGDQTSLYTDGDRIFVTDGASQTPYNDVTTINGVPAFGGGNTTFTTTLVYVSDRSGGVCNNLSTHTNYRVEIKIYEDTNTTLLLTETLEYVPKQSGFLEIDFKDVIIFLLRSTVVESLHWNFDFREVWVEDTSAAFASNANAQQSTYSELGWHNLSSYYLYFGSTLATADRDRLLSTKFNSGMDTTLGTVGPDLGRGMVLIRGWNYFLSIAEDENFNSRNGGDIQVRESTADINGGTKVLIAVYAVTTAVKIHTYKITNNDNAAEYLICDIEEDFTNTNCYNNYFIRVLDEPENPIMLQWLNEFGGRDQWMFSVNQQITHDISPGPEFINKEVELIQSDKDSYQRYGNTLIQKITVFTTKVHRKQMEALRYISQSDLVYVWLSENSAAGDNWTGNIIQVVIEPNTFTFDMKDEVFDLEFTLKMPPGRNFFEEKRY